MPKRISYNKLSRQLKRWHNSEASSVYYGTLHQLGIVMIGLTILELALTICAFALLDRITHLGLTRGRLLFGFWQWVIEIIAGIAVLILCRKRSSLRLFFRIELFSLIAVIGIKITAFFFRIDESFIDTQLFFLFLILYSIRQLRMDERNQILIYGSEPTVLDLKLTSKDQWFNPRMIGPRFKLDREISDAIDGFLETQATPAPLEINIHGLGDVSETMEGTMRDALQEHYEDEAKRIGHYLESRYKRALLLIAISIVVLEIWIKTNGAQDISITKIVMSNIAAFSLWQVGTVYFERKDAHARLLRATIAKAADIQFL